MKKWKVDALACVLILAGWVVVLAWAGHQKPRPLAPETCEGQCQHPAGEKCRDLCFGREWCPSEAHRP